MEAPEMILQIARDRWRAVVRCSDEDDSAYLVPQLGSVLHQRDSYHEPAHAMRDQMNRFAAVGAVEFEDEVSEIRRTQAQGLPPVVRKHDVTQVISLEDCRPERLVRRVGGARSQVMVRMGICETIDRKAKIV